MSSPPLKKRKVDSGGSLPLTGNLGGHSGFPTMPFSSGMGPPPRFAPIQTPNFSFGTPQFNFTPIPTLGQTKPSSQTTSGSPSGFIPIQKPVTPFFTFPTQQQSRQSQPQSTPKPSLFLPSIPTQSQPIQPSTNQPSTFQPITTQQSNSTTTQPLQPSLPVVPTVRFRIGENGKVHYFKRDDSTAQQTHASSYVEMDAKDFTTFKNSGKRYGSSKITDPSSMQSYVMHSGQFYEFDKTASNKRGKLATDQSGLLSKHQGGQLVDRSRTDRIGGALQPFDVGHYKQAPSGSKMDALSGKSETFGANRDHVVSGESLRRRAKAANQNDDHAYNQGLTIAIPNDEMHKLHSPTFGGRQKSKDKVDGTQKHRVDHDATQPALAFHRDTTMMLERTANQNHGSVHSDLDLTQAKNRVRQVGAYRTLFKASTAMFAKDSNRGFDPTVTAFDLTHVPKSKPKDAGKIGTFTSVTSTSGQSQGTRLAQSLTKNLKDTGKAK